MAKEQSLPKAWGEINALKSGKLDKDNEGNIKIKGVAPKIEIFPNSPIQGAQGIIDFMDADGQHVRLRHNSYDSTRAPFGLHIERHPDNIQPSNRAYLDVEGQIFADGGGRVYNTNYKPTASDVGAAPSTHYHNIIQVRNEDWNAQSQDFKTGTANNPTGSGVTGYADWIQWGHNGGTKYRHTIYSFADPTKMKQLFYAYKNNSTDVSSSATSAEIFTTESCPISKAQNGYCKLANGMIMQWGRVNTSTGTVSITFPIAFPNAVQSIQWTDGWDGIAAETTYLLSANIPNNRLTLYSFVVVSTYIENSSKTVLPTGHNNNKWFAIGY